MTGPGATLLGPTSAASASNPDPSLMPVMAKVCDRCLLGSSPLVSDMRRSEILAECEASGRAFICHKATIAGEYAVCRSFYEKDLSLAVILARKLGRARFVEVRV